MRVNSVVLAAASFGIQDLLAERGIVPVTVGGLSLGDMVSASATGAIARSDMFRLLYAASHEPASAAAEAQEAIALAFVPAGTDPSLYYAPQSEGIYLGSSFGKVRWRDGEAFMLAGYRSALEQFRDRHPEGNVKVRDQRLCSAAYHSPLREPARAQLAGILDGVRIEDPAMPICSPILDRPVTTAAGVRDLLLRNCVEPAWVAKMLAQVVAFEPRLVVTIGPAMAKGMFVFPVPAVHVDSLETLAEVAGAVADAELVSPAV
jgi:[acyl-carrier-protein] S-malonyltransferase